MYSVTRVFRTVEVPFLRVELDLKAPAGCRSARAGSYTDSEHPSLSLWRLSGRTYNFFKKKIEEHGSGPPPGRGSWAHLDQSGQSKKFQPGEFPIFQIQKFQTLGREYRTRTSAW